MAANGRETIGKGFWLEEPAVFVPWRIREGELETLLGARLRRVTDGYYTIECRSLGGMRHHLGFHFKPCKNGRLAELEFFQKDGTMEQSFEEFQRYFEDAFGKPTESAPGLCGFPGHEWRLARATIVHFVMERFGPEEHMRIKAVNPVVGLLRWVGLPRPSV